MTASITSTAYAPDRLIAGNAQLLNSQKVTLLSGMVLVRGAILGKITSGGKYNLSLSAASDGSQVPDLVLAHDADASGGDVVVVAYNRGDFDESAIVLGTAHTADTVREGLRLKGITLIKSVA
jgi:hypothetical protein